MAFCRANNDKVASIPIMVIVTNSSISVKPFFNMDLKLPDKYCLWAHLPQSHNRIYQLSMSPNSSHYLQGGSVPVAPIKHTVSPKPCLLLNHWHYIHNDLSPRDQWNNWSAPRSHKVCCPRLYLLSYR